MIACDEVTMEIDSQLSRIDELYARLPGEETYVYLNRLRSKIGTLPANLCNRIAYLHHTARFSPQKFEIQHLMEIRSLLNQFVKIINNQVPSPGTAIFSAKNLQSSISRRGLRTKFGGSDESSDSSDDSEGGRLLANVASDERVALLPSGSQETPSRRRRQSDSNQPLLG